MAFYTEVEFYVLAVVTAAAVVGLCVKPSGKGEARQYLLSGRLNYDGAEESPSIEVEVGDDGVAILTRRGLQGAVNSDGAVSLAVNVAGFDITIDERIVAGSHTPLEAQPNSASFTLDFLGPERYHILYRSETIGGALAAMPLHVRPGIKASRQLA